LLCWFGLLYELVHGRGVSGTRQFRQVHAGGQIKQIFTSLQITITVREFWLTEELVCDSKLNFD